MTAVNVPQFEPREKASGQRQDVIGYVATPGSAYEERRAFISCFVRVFEGEIAHTFKVRGEHIDRNSQPEMVCPWCSNEIGEQKLPYGQCLDSDSFTSKSFVLYCTNQLAVL